ncbi:P2Y purinoceptor 11 [Varanus komodoensis]|uniref:P2Y purinoceptor 11-like n=1 Tax=Varanus komodoensis TaxID=61221 RepID=UPI001CF7A38C|nr:P2Y purinoceptor 11-like [Varanus komodoensis]KAF7240240.1 P2Y purinoceptor 11 [Varanus komodoensis]
MSLAGHGNITRSCRDDLSSFFQEQIWPILLLQFLLAIVGNGFAIYRFLTYKQKWNINMVYSFNLAVSDLLYAFSLLPIILYYFPPKDWIYGHALCSLDRFFFFCNLYGSTFFIACISLNRWVAIVHPIFAHGRMKSYHAKLLSGAVWLLVAAISTPVLSFSTLNYVSEYNITQCLGSASSEQLPKYWPYSLFLLAFGFGLPFVLTSISCGGIIYTIHHNHNVTAMNKCKVKALVSVVVILYIIFYLPFHILQNLYLSHRMRTKEDCGALIPTSFQVAKILVHFHICIHPLVYTSQANSMQKYFSRCFQRWNNVPGEGNNVELRLQDRLPS